ncbi:unnamed protein product [Prunus armeniaca]|uniref:Uncharacterized protein n=1 Tax=Prunus armeniaca TaxID=36596 RepID=A0A6J5XB77_PRUAR|nr:unnamed protein product [Prunus armeniaca]
MNPNSSSTLCISISLPPYEANPYMGFWQTIEVCELDGGKGHSGRVEAGVELNRLEE